MKKNHLTMVIIIMLTSIMVFATVALSCAHIHREMIRRQESQMKEKAIDNAKKNKYPIHVIDENTLLVKKDEIDFYFNISPSRVDFNNCEFYVEEDNTDVKEGNIKITITDLEDEKIDVFYDDSRIIILDDGSEEVKFSTGYFISDKDFSENSLTVPNNWIPDGEHKIKKSYNKIMKFTTVEELKKHYNEALDICAELNS